MYLKQNVTGAGQIKEGGQDLNQYGSHLFSLNKLAENLKIPIMFYFEQRGQLEIISNSNGLDFL